MKVSLVESIEEKLIAQLTEKFDAKPELHDGLVFLGVDSVGMAELSVEIEKEFGIQIDDQIVNVDTVQELADYIREKQQQAKK